MVHSALGIFLRYDDVSQALSEIGCHSLRLSVLDIRTGTGNLPYLCLAYWASLVGFNPLEKMLALQSFER